MCKETNTDAIFATHRQRKNNPPMLCSKADYSMKKDQYFYLSSIVSLSISSLWLSPSHDASMLRDVLCRRLPASATSRGG